MTLVKHQAAFSRSDGKIESDQSSGPIHLDMVHRLYIYYRTTTHSRVLLKHYQSMK